MDIFFKEEEIMLKKILLISAMLLLLVNIVHAETFDFGTQPIEINPITDIIADEIKNDTGDYFEYHDLNDKVLKFKQEIKVNNTKLENVEIKNIKEKTFLEKQYKITSMYKGFAIKNNIIEQNWEAPENIHKVDENAFEYCQQDFVNLYFTSYIQTTCTRVDYSTEVENYNITFQATSDRTWTTYLSPKNQSSLIDEEGYLVLDPVIVTYVYPTPPSGVFTNINNFYVNFTTDPTEENYAFLVLNDGTVRYDFDNNTGSSDTYFADYFGKFNATQTSPTRLPTYVTGAYNKALNFNGSQNINITPNPWFTMGAKNPSFSIRIYTSNLTFGTGVQVVFDDSIGNPGTNTGMWFGIDGRGGGNAISGFQWALRANSSSTRAEVCDNCINSTLKWWHIVGTWNSTNITFYVDGIKKVSRINGVNSGTGSYIPRNALFKIGSLNDNTVFSNVSVDELIFLNRTVSDQEAYALYQANINPYFRNFTRLGDGTFTFIAYSVNTSGSIASLSQNITIDTITPVITIASPQNNTYFNSRNVLINVSITDTWQSSLNIDLNGSLTLFAEFENKTGENATNFKDSSLYSNNLTCTDIACPIWLQYAKFGAGLTFDGTDDIITTNLLPNAQTIGIWIKNSTASYWSYVVKSGGIFYVDGIPSTIYEFPINITSTSLQVGVNGSLYFNGSVDGLKTWNYNLTQSEINSSINGVIYRYQSIIPTYSDGVKYWFIYSKDLAGNMANQTAYTLTVDTINPTINFTIPTTNGQYVNRNFIEVNTTSTDINLANITINLYNASNSLLRSNITITSPNYINYSNMVDGSYFFNATATDFANNKNSTITYNITLDTTFPLINFTSPTPDNATTQIGNLNIIFNVSANDINLANITYYILNESNYVLNSTTYTTLVTNTSLSVSDYGTYLYHVVITDLANNINQTETRTIYIQKVIIIGGSGSTGGSTNSYVCPTGQEWITIDTSHGVCCPIGNEYIATTPTEGYCRPKSLNVTQTIQPLSNLSLAEKIINTVNSQKNNLWQKLNTNKCVPLTKLNPNATDYCQSLGLWIILSILIYVLIYYTLKSIINATVKNEHDRKQAIGFIIVILILAFFIISYGATQWF